MPDEVYQGYRLVVEAFDPTGSARAARASVFKGADTHFTVETIVTYTFAGSRGADPAELAEDLARTWARGLIGTSRFEVGAQYQVRRDSYYEVENAAMDDDDLRSELLFALQRMKRAESEMPAVPWLDTQAFAQVLGVEVSRVRSLLTELLAEGLVRETGGISGATVSDGRCEITGAGLREIRQIAKTRPPRNQRGQVGETPSSGGLIDMPAQDSSSEPYGQTAGYVFLSCVREDGNRIDALQANLEAAGLNVWRDVKDLWPGDLWKDKLRAAIQNEALAFVPCFSEATAAREKSTMFEEVIWASEEYRRRNPDRPWIFPVFLDPVAPPNVDLGSSRTLSDLHWTNLYEGWDDQVIRLIEAIRRLLPGGGSTGSASSSRGQPNIGQVEVSAHQDSEEPKEGEPIGDASELLKALQSARVAGTTTDSRTGVGGEVFWYNEMAEGSFVVHPGLSEGQISVIPAAVRQLEVTAEISVLDRPQSGRGHTFMITPTRLVMTATTTKPSMRVTTRKPFQRRAMSFEEIGDRLEREGPFDVAWVESGAAKGSGTMEIRYAPSLPIRVVDVRLWRSDIDRIRESGAPLDTPLMSPGDILRVPLHLDLSIGRRMGYSVIYTFEGEPRAAREQRGEVDTS